MNLTGVLTLLFLITVKASCPWDDTKLVAWSSVSTWGGSVPVEDEAVVISGKKVLLDISPPALKSITVETGGVLVWGNVDGIKLVVDHILVKGEFHIGAEQCRFTNKAHILLTGFPNTTNTVSGFGSKFIGVPEGGTLEIHGADKLPFTKLMQTISAETLTCGVLYTHRNSSFSEEDRFGLHVTIWRDDGSLYDFNVYPLGDSSVINPEQDFKDFVDGVDDGLIVGVAVYGDIGVNLIPNRNWELVYSSVEKLGGLTSGSSEIRNVQSKDAYAFITKTGEGSSTKEERAKSLYLQESTATSKQKYSSIARGLEFRSRSIVKAVTKTKIENQVDFDVVSTTFSQPIITVRDDVSSWNVGDKIIITSTSFDWKQVEKFTLLECSECTSKQIKLNSDFQYPHFGEITHGVDERAEVALLTRNILIEGGLQEQCYHTTDAEADLCQKFQRDTFGGHVKFLRGFKAVHIEGVELYHMGQQLIIGTYPLHFHMCDDVDDSWVRQNSIHNTNNRCVTIHGSDGAEIKDNVCFDHIGHGYFLEDSAEIRNVLDGNLGVGTRFGTQLLTDKRSDWCGSVQKKSCGHPATFWITHPMNYFRNNVAAGSEKNGFHIVYAYEPLTSSKARQEIRKKVFRMHARRSKLGQFDDNVAHSNLGFGLMMDNLISMGQIDLLTNEFVPENGLLGSSGYDPREDPSVRNSPRATNHIRRFTSYKNLNNIWTRGGNLIIHNSSFADGETSISLTRSVLDTVQDVRRSVIIGNSDNKGLGFKFTYGKIPAKPSHYFERELPKESNPFNPMVGIEFFNGPVLVTDSIFDKFYHQVWDPTWEKQYGVKAMRPGTAMGFRKNFPYPSFPHSGPRNVRFGFCDKVDGLSVFAGDTSLLAYADPKDGDRQATIRDITGSVTGIPDVQLVRNTPFFMDTDCYYDQVYQMSVCPHWYSKTHLRGSDGVFKDKKDDYPMFMVRDDDPENPFALKGADITSEYHVQGTGDKGLTYLTMQNKSYIAVFNGTNPTSIKIRSNNIQYGNWIRVGICFPKSTTSFTIRATYPEIDDKNPPISVSSIEALEEDETGRAYFWDKKTGLFFVRFVGRLQRTGYEECPGYKCPEYRITRNDGGSAVTDCTSDAYGAYKKSKSTREPIVPPNTPCVRASTVGYGATSPSELSITVPKFPTSCPALPAHEKPTREYRGCYATTSPAYLTAGRTQVLTESMTIDLCVTRCFNMANKYATVALGSTCRCSNDFNIQGQPSKFCGKACTGNQEEICGGNSAYGVYETGAGSISISTSCGSGNEGVLIEGKCYIYKADAVTYVEAEKQCRLLGGNLASIPNSSVQENVEAYVKSYNTTVWFGLNDAKIEGTYMNADGTSQGHFRYFAADAGLSASEDFFALLPQQYYRWSELSGTNLLPYLCQVSQSASPRTEELCGVKNAGKVLSGSDQCYAILDKKSSFGEAEYDCYRMFGVLAPVPDSATENEIREHIIRYGSPMDYWVNKKKEGSSRIYALVYNQMFYQKDFSSNTQHGVVCLLDTLSAAKPCATGWRRYGDHCYLYTGVVEPDFSKAQTLCKSDSTSLVSIESEQENSDVLTLVKEVSSKSPSVFLGLKYNSSQNKFNWSDGSAVTYTNWAKGQGVDAVASNGECSRLLSNGQWKNKKCSKTNAHIVCKANVAS